MKEPKKNELCRNNHLLPLSSATNENVLVDVESPNPNNHDGKKEEQQIEEAEVVAAVHLNPTTVMATLVCRAATIKKNLFATRDRLHPMREPAVGMQQTHQEERGEGGPSQRMATTWKHLPQATWRVERLASWLRDNSPQGATETLDLQSRVARRKSGRNPICCKPHHQRWRIKMSRTTIQHKVASGGTAAATTTTTTLGQL